MCATSNQNPAPCCFPNVRLTAGEEKSDTRATRIRFPHHMSIYLRYTSIEAPQPKTGDVLLRWAANRSRYLPLDFLPREGGRRQKHARADCLLFESLVREGGAHSADLLRGLGPTRNNFPYVYCIIFLISEGRIIFRPSAEASAMTAPHSAWAFAALAAVAVVALMGTPAAAGNYEAE